jgi:transcriptional regulator with XRE-family HTH domain
MKTGYIPFAKSLRELRKKHKLSTRDVADELGVSEAAICAYESAYRSPSLAILMDLASLFHTSLDVMAGREGLPPAKQCPRCHGAGFVHE